MGVRLRFRYPLFCLNSPKPEISRFFDRLLGKEVAGEVGAGVGASVSWVEENYGAGGGLLGGGGDGDEARQDGEGCGDLSVGWGQGRLVDCKG